MDPCDCPSSAARPGPGEGGRVHYHQQGCVGVARTVRSWDTSYSVLDAPPLPQVGRLSRAVDTGTDIHPPPSKRVSAYCDQCSECPLGCSRAPSSTASERLA